MIYCDDKMQKNPLRFFKISQLFFCSFSIWLLIPLVFQRHQHSEGEKETLAQFPGAKAEYTQKLEFLQVIQIQFLFIKGNKDDINYKYRSTKKIRWTK